MDLLGAAPRRETEEASLPSTPNQSPPDLPDLLTEAIQLIEGLGEGYEHVASRLGELRDRLAQGQFHLAVLGQFKRGKSTLLNALLGDAALPTAVVPLTATPTFIRPGKTIAARVHFQDEREPHDAEVQTAGHLCDFLAGFVTETGNPNNKLGVTQVDVFYPAVLLGKGVVLIDTPGIGSTFRHNTEATLNFLPQCDAALFLVSADPPITEVEVGFLRQVCSKVGRLFFIFNKVDYLSDEDLQAALAFLRKVLTEQVGVPAEAAVFCVSARQGLEARAKRDDGLWAASGLAQVEKHLVEFLANEKAAALREAVGRKAADTLGENLMRLRLAVRSLQIPLDDLQKRLMLFEAKIDEAKQQRVSAADLLAGDNRRMHEFLEEHAEVLRRQAREYLSGVVQESLAPSSRVGEGDVQDTLAEAIPGYFERQVGQTTEVFRQCVADTLRPHQHRVDELIESVRKTAADLFDVPYDARGSSDTFEVIRQPYWVTYKWSSTLSPIPMGLIDRLLPVSAQQRRIRKLLLGQAGELVVANVENLRWAIFQSINQTFTRFGSTLDKRLAETVEATHGVIRAVVERRRSRSEITAKETSRFEKAAAELEQLRAGLGGS